MRLFFFEATNGTNWGKFAIGLFTAEEWAVRSQVDEAKLLRGRGWDEHHLLFLDLQTGEGTMLRPGGLVEADLEKHAVWICPMAEPFLKWLYKSIVRARVDIAHAQLHDLASGGLPFILEALAHNPLVTLTEEEAPSSLWGHRRPATGAPLEGLVGALQKAVRARKALRSGLNQEREHNAIQALVAAFEAEPE